MAVIRSLILVLILTLGFKSFAEDDVFLDEGDGDLAIESLGDSSDPVGNPEASNPAAAKPTEDLKIPAESSAPEVVKAQTAEPAKPKVTQKIEKKKVQKNSKSAQKSKGHFGVTKGECPMHRSPASTSGKMLVVRSEKKVWVEDVNGKWVRGYDKDGKPGYLSKTCFE